MRLYRTLGLLLVAVLALPTVAALPPAPCDPEQVYVGERFIFGHRFHFHGDADHGFVIDAWARASAFLVYDGPVDDGDEGKGKKKFRHAYAVFGTLGDFCR